MNSSKKVLLIVDDRADNAALAGEVLRRLNIRDLVLTVIDGAYAADYLIPPKGFAQAGLWSPPALVLLDMESAKSNSLEVLARLRAHPRTLGVPVVLLSSHDEAMRQAAAASGPTLFVTKPLTEPGMTRVLERFGFCAAAQLAQAAMLA